MLITIDQLRSRVEHELPALVADLQALTGRYGSEEADAWQRSLKRMSHVFRAPSFKPLHLYFGSKGNLALEYQLPAASSWCDVVLLGQHEQRPAAVIVELKDWQTADDSPGAYEGLVVRHGAQELHPSDQVRGYAEYCRRFHTAVQDHAANVHGCVLFTRDHWTDAYTAEPNARLASEYPIFTLAEEDVDRAFPEYFQQRLTEPHESFARDFEQGGYRQERGFVAQIGKQILDPANSVFELLDGQRRAFALCQSVVRRTFHGAGRKRPQKKVVIIQGPPGSGKSVIAARLWAALVTDEELPEGDVVMTTTSASQSRNWQWIFRQASQAAGGQGVVRKANAYVPITTQDLGRLRTRRGDEWLSDAEAWRENLQLLRDLGVPFRRGAEDNGNLVSIVDEAHALINPEHVEGRGQFGFVPTIGPQAYHIIRSSLLTVFLLDPLQGFRQRENTTIDDLGKWSRELGAGKPIEISLEGMQYRCAGSTEYVAWLESVLAGNSAEKNVKLTASWRAVPDRLNTRRRGSGGEVPDRPLMDLRILADPTAWEAALRDRISAGCSARLLATYCREWKTRDATRPHDLPAEEMDFHERYMVGKQSTHWSRIWNYVPRQDDYTWFVAGHPASFIAKDPLCEVGCPYAVRGFDYDYVGVLWLDDLLWRDGKWVVNPVKVHESGVAALARAARRESRHQVAGSVMEELLERVTQTYRILLTRGIKGAYVWVPDAETRAHLERSLGADGR